jgi:site-specific recombinase XerD
MKWFEHQAGARRKFVFVNRHGRPLSARRVYENWRKAAKLAGIEATCYEGTRHSLASQAVNKGVSMRVVKEFLGHKNEKSTCRYAKVMVSSLRKIWGEE